MSGSDDAGLSAATIWGSAPYEQVARTLAEMHDHLVEELRPRRGERWLDVATGTGGVAERAAGAGAAVAGIDLAPALIAAAEQRAARRRLSIRYRVADAEHLPYPDAALDVVASAVGVAFAAHHRRAARELARVCRRGGRVGLTGWRLAGGGICHPRQYLLTLGRRR